MICPYNGFKPMDCTKCAAWIRLCDLSKYGNIDSVCAIAYNGGAVPDQKVYMLPAQQMPPQMEVPF